MSFIKADLIQKRVQRRLQRLTGKDKLDLTDSETLNKLKSHLELEYEQELCIREEKLINEEKQRLEKLAAKTLELNNYQRSHNSNAIINHSTKQRIQNSRTLKTEFVPNPVRKSKIGEKKLQVRKAENVQQIKNEKENVEMEQFNHQQENEDMDSSMITEESIYQIKRPYTARILELQKEKKIDKIYEIAAKLVKNR